MGDKQEYKPDNIIFERRRFKRISRNFVVSYAPIKTEEFKFDVSQTKNLSEGGLMLITDKKFEKEVVLKIKLRLPEFSDYVIVRAEVIDSKQLAKGIIYETRARFVEVEENVKEAIRKLVDYG